MSFNKKIEADVLIIGGSFGGVAAALTAAKMGKKVILTEETKWLGGQATTQGVPIDEHPWIEQYGCTRSYREFRQLIRNYYMNNYPVTYESRKDPFFNPGAGWVSGLGFEPRVGLAVIEQMLAPYRSAGLINTYMKHIPVAAQTEDDRISSVTLKDTINNTETIMTAPFILDATELGDLIELAGVEHVIGAESVEETGEPSALDGESDPMRQQGFTHLAAVDYLPGEDHTIERPEFYDKWRPQLEPWINSMVGGMKGLFHDTMLAEDGSMSKSPEYRTCIWNFRRVLCRDNFEPGAFASDITMLMCGNEYKLGQLVGVSKEEADKNMREARELTLSLIYFLQSEVTPGYNGKAGFPGIRPRGDVFGTKDGLAQYPYIREARRIKAEFTVKEQHFNMNCSGNENGPVLFDDSIGVGAYRIDLHEPAKNSKHCVTDALHGTCWPQQIPLGSLVPIRVKNMIPACKNIGSTHMTNGCFRLHCTEWNIGEAAGALAAYCVDNNKIPHEVNNEKDLLKDYQQILLELGVELEWPQMSYARSYASHYTQIPGWYGGESWRLK